MAGQYRLGRKEIWHIEAVWNINLLIMSLFSFRIICYVNLFAVLAENHHVMYYALLVAVLFCDSVKPLTKLSKFLFASFWETLFFSKKFFKCSNCQLANLFVQGTSNIYSMETVQFSATIDILYLYIPCLGRRRSWYYTISFPCSF